MALTLEDAKKLAKIAAEVDGGCSVCVPAVCEELTKAFPDFLWSYDETKRFEEDGAAVSVVSVHG